MIIHMILMFAICLALMLIGAGPDFDNPSFMFYVLGVVLLSPFLSVLIMSAMASFADWSDRRARAGRIARAKARKGEGA
ncbi:hypothetical protein [Aeromonas caviae]|uniref:hypothetical protein n=1 Tax=Aeromonas caviae TaxID=648 RepID=UPI002B484306|nr:hypothetical protein [Aeromonas caviae]